RDLRLNGEIMQNPQGNRRIHHSPLHQEYLEIALGYNKAMQEWPTVADAAAELNMSVNGVRDALKRLGRPARPLLIGSTVRIIPPEDFAALTKDQEIGTHAMSASEIARRANVPLSQAKSAIKELRLVGALTENRSRTTYEATDAALAIKHLKANATG